MPVALITGLNGFTGRYLAPLLQAKGYRVVGLDAHHIDGPYEVRRCNLLDLGSMSNVVQEVQPMLVAHLAAISFVAHGNVSEIYQANLVGTRNLLQALATGAPTVRSVLLASSANIYGNCTDNPITETSAAAPANDYAVSKLAMEYMARIWMDKLPITIVRPFNYTGVGQSVNFLLPKLVDHFRRKVRSIELGNLDVERDFSDVRTVARIYAELLERTPRGEVFNVCSGQTFSLQQVVGLLEQLAGYQIEVKVNPAFVRSNEVKTLCGSVSKLQNLLGVIDTAPLVQTLEWMLNA